MHDPVNIQQGQQAVAAGLISREQAFQCLEEATRRRCSLFQVAVQAGMLRSEDAHRLHAGGSPGPAPTDSARPSTPPAPSPAAGAPATSSPDSTRTVAGTNPLLASGSSSGSGVIAPSSGESGDLTDSTRTVAGGMNPMLASGSAPAGHGAALSDSTRTVAGGLNPMLAGGPGVAPGPTASSPDMPPPSLLSGEVPLPEIGQVLDGYEIIRELGRGGMGAVFVARKGGTDYALKAIITADESALARFDREAQACAEVDDHPNIVRIRHYAKHGMLPYLVLDLVEGKGLEDILEPGTPLELDRALELAMKIASSLQHIHDKGVIHRDLKPANILIRSEDGEPMLTDFGLARGKDAEALTRTSDFLGTPNYMSPEQAGSEHENVGPPTDVFALGVMLYEFTTGHRPFVGDSVMAIIKRIMFEDPLPPSTHVPDMNPDLETVILKAINKDIPDRYENAAALAEDLRRLRDGEPIVGKRLSAWELRRNRIIRRYGDRGLKLAKVAAALVLAVTLTAVGVKFWSTPRETETSSYKTAGEPLQTAWTKLEPKLPSLLISEQLGSANLDFSEEARQQDQASLDRFVTALKENLQRRASIRQRYVQADWILDPALDPRRLQLMLSVLEVLKVAGHKLDVTLPPGETCSAEPRLLRIAQLIGEPGRRRDGFAALKRFVKRLSHGEPAQPGARSPQPDGDEPTDVEQTGASEQMESLLIGLFDLTLEAESIRGEFETSPDTAFTQLENLLETAEDLGRREALEVFVLPAAADALQRSALKSIEATLTERAAADPWPADQWGEAASLTRWSKIPNLLARELGKVVAFVGKHKTFFRGRDVWKFTRSRLIEIASDPATGKDPVKARVALAIHRALFDLYDGFQDADGDTSQFEWAGETVRKILPLSEVGQPVHEALSGLQIRLLKNPGLVGSVSSNDESATRVNVCRLGVRRFYEFVYVIDGDRPIPPEYCNRQVDSVCFRLVFSGRYQLDAAQDGAEAVADATTRRSLFIVMRLTCFAGRAGFVPRFLGQEISRMADRLRVMEALETFLRTHYSVSPEFLFWKSNLTRRIKGVDEEVKRQRQRALLKSQLAAINAALKPDSRLHPNLRGLALARRWGLVREARKLSLPDLPENAELIKDLRQAVANYHHHEPDVVLLETLHLLSAENAPSEELLTLSHRVEKTLRRRRELTLEGLRAGADDANPLARDRDPEYPLRPLEEKEYKKELSELYAKRGDIFNALRRFEDALKLAKQSLELNDTAAAFYVQLNAYLNQRQVEKARRVIEDFKRRHPNMTVGDVNDLQVRRMTRIIDEATRGSK